MLICCLGGGLQDAHLIDADDIVEVDGFPAIDIRPQGEVHVLHRRPTLPPTHSYYGLPSPHTCKWCEDLLPMRFILRRIKS